ncbi:deoxyribose-phosphate aldolase [Gellertiella hungarica]|uniref:Deoxyribose-phosphate aldolase n=1 Tax=Gellertiella hungarica TaxID=1572859 RepID=A0A7W6NMK2_9HYPH|nr:deoxyribose-phosphate aldolase [Gellertiella hungarica]MBB4066472.1 deoxyribose-phosphate aldolase [Gellertiella hungarica]
MDNLDAARRALSVLDLTNLKEDCTPEQIDALVEKAATRHGNVAAICIWPRFVAQARARLGQGSAIRIATVMNFPSGDAGIAETVAETRQALEDGADEIDLVIPYKAFAKGNADAVSAMVSGVRAAIAAPARLKVILETGELKDAGLIRNASDLAIAAGADFIKTSTGKTAGNATEEAALIMLDAILASGRPVGLKPSGGIGSVPVAARYLALADEKMGAGWAVAENFRFGASGLLDDILRVLDGGQSTAGGAGY